MHPKDFASLVSAINDWGEKNCDNVNDNSDLYWPEDYAILMAKAAEAVFDAFVSERKWIDDDKS